MEDTIAAKIESKEMFSISPLGDLESKFLEKIGESAEALDSCRFCHSEKTDVEVEKQVQSDGHYIVPIDGCPNN